MYGYGCISELKLSFSLSAKEADSLDTSMESDALQSFDAATLRAWARSLTGRRR